MSANPCPQCEGQLFPTDEPASSLPAKSKSLYQCNKNPYHIHWIESVAPDDSEDESEINTA